MIDIILGILFGYWLGKKKVDQEYTGSIVYNGVDYGYVKQGESVEDLL